MKPSTKNTLKKVVLTAGAAGLTGFVTLGVFSKPAQDAFAETLRSIFGKLTENGAAIFSKVLSGIAMGLLFMALAYVFCKLQDIPSPNLGLKESRTTSNLKKAGLTIGAAGLTGFVTLGVFSKPAQDMFAETLRSISGKLTENGADILSKVLSSIAMGLLFMALAYVFCKLQDVRTPNNTLTQQGVIFRNRTSIYTD